MYALQISYPDLGCSHFLGVFHDACLVKFWSTISGRKDVVIILHVGQLNNLIGSRGFVKSSSLWSTIRYK